MNSHSINEIISDCRLYIDQINNPDLYELRAQQDDELRAEVYNAKQSDAKADISIIEMLKIKWR